MPGPGFYRYKARIDTEALRLQVLREQEEALKYAAEMRRNQREEDLRNRDLPPVREPYYPIPAEKKAKKISKGR